MLALLEFGEALLHSRCEARNSLARPGRPRRLHGPRGPAGSLAPEWYDRIRTMQSAIPLKADQTDLNKYAASTSARDDRQNTGYTIVMCAKWVSSRCARQRLGAGKGGLHHLATTGTLPRSRRRHQDSVWAARRTESVTQNDVYARLHITEFERRQSKLYSSLYSVLVLFTG